MTRKRVTRAAIKRGLELLTPGQRIRFGQIFWQSAGLTQGATPEEITLALPTRMLRPAMRLIDGTLEHNAVDILGTLAARHD